MGQVNDTAASADWLLNSLRASYNGPARLQLHTGLSSPPKILDVSEGDLITVIQPDGSEEKYRLTRKTPTSDRFGWSFEFSPVPEEP